MRGRAGHERKGAVMGRDTGAAGTELGGRTTELHDCRAWGEDGRAGREAEAHIPKAE